LSPRGIQSQGSNFTAACGGPDVFCPEASPLPSVVSNGWYTVGGDEQHRQAQVICEIGYYCQQGVSVACPAGTFGNVTGMNVDNRIGEFAVSFPCSGFCSPGFYCPLNSTSATQVACPPGRYGATAGLKNVSCTAICPQGHYCPQASTQPTKCRAGIFGNRTGLMGPACSVACWEGGCDDIEEGSICREGYFCPEGSVVATQRECGGSGLYCPAGSSMPSAAWPGFYTVGAQLGLNKFEMGNALSRITQIICEIGNYCVDGVMRQCPPGTFGNTQGLTTAMCSGLCSPGFFCPMGTENATTFRCAAGRYGSQSGLFLSACSGVCSQGYYCPEGSTSSFQFPCTQGSPLALSDTGKAGYINFFAENQTSSPNSVFCPQGSSVPLVVFQGFFSLGNNRTTNPHKRHVPWVRIAPMESFLTVRPGDLGDPMLYFLRRAPVHVKKVTIVPHCPQVRLRSPVRWGDMEIEKVSRMLHAQGLVSTPWIVRWDQ